jgi:hypothetical protein
MNEEFAASVVNAPAPPAAKFPETRIVVYVPAAVITAAAHAGAAVGVGVPAGVGVAVGVAVGVDVAAAPGVTVAGVIDAAETPVAVAEIVALVSGAPV